MCSEHHRTPPFPPPLLMNGLRSGHGSSLRYPEEGSRGALLRQSLLEDATTTSSLRLCWDDKELFTVQALATGAAPEFEELQVRTACDGRALIELRLQALPLVDEPADVLNLLLALPWLPQNDLATHVRNRLMEDLLVDLCDIEGSESEHDCATERDEAGGERPMVRRKTSSEPVSGQKRKK